MLCFIVESGGNLGRGMNVGIELLFESIARDWFTLFKVLIQRGVAVTSINPIVSI